MVNFFRCDTLILRRLTFSWDFFTSTCGFSLQITAKVKLIYDFRSMNLIGAKTSAPKHHRPALRSTFSKTKSLVLKAQSVSDL